MAASFSAPSSAALPLQSSVQPKKLINQDQMGSSPLHATTARSSQTSSAAIISEEHTSELQSLMRNSYAVFCLNKQIHIIQSNYILPILYKRPLHFCHSFISFIT